ncbi:MAG: lamin tail domain-containing protein, partial [Bacteroidales bacterium]|nr:lamin tail domain-containing protein [Bacteroidales bacterium]
FSAGQPEIHDIPIDSTTSTTVFRNVPIRMQATPKPGYAFSHWSGASTSLDPFLTLSLADSDTLIAHFKEAPPVENLFINELSSRSENGIPDEYGEPEDWIELYNGNSEPLYLDNLFLTDSIQDPLKHKITDDRSNLIIQPGEYLILFADGDTHQGIRHLNFKLSNQGETIALVQKIGIRRNHIIDSVSFRKQGTGATYGRSPIDPDRFQFLIPTPGSQNDEKTIDNILINEFVSSNRSGAKDNHGEYEDWIELYNSGEEVVSVSGMFITDSLPDRTRYQIPFVENDSLSLNPGEHLLLWADNQPEQGCRHLGFRLSGSGESIALVQPNGFDFIDSLSYGDIRQDVAMGCLPDGSSSFQLVTPTPGDTNTVNLLDSIFINELVASNRNSGQDEYEETDDWIELYNGNNLPVDVGGLYITDSVPATIKCRIPSYCPDSTTIPAKGFLRFWADNSPEQGILHLNFKLSNKGERLGLVQQNGIDFIDSLEYPELAKDAAWGRIPDGSSGIQLVSASPLEPNRVDTLSNLFINEIMSSNTYTIQDEFAEYDDWIELYNANSFPVDIGGLYLTDSLGNHIKQRISEDSSALTTIAARGHLILWADNQPEQGILHLNFKLSNAGEDIGLFLEDGLTSVDSLVYHENNADASLGRFPDGSDTLEYMLPTPGTENLRNVIENVLISELASSTNHLFPDEYGELNDWIELYNNNPWPVSIGGLYLTDSLNFPRKYRIPNRSPDSTTIPAKGRLILWADNQVDQGILHLDFALSGKGEELALVNTDGKRILDALSFPDQYPDISYGRENDTLQWKAMRPTPGEPNINEDFQGIMISEIAADNENRFPDEYGNFSDWIEIYNPNSYPVDMGGCFLTDSLGNPVKFRIPADNPDKTTIPANNYLILFADDSTSLGPLHTNFKLSRQGEKLGLYHFNTTKRLDYLTFGEQYKNFAFARELSSGQWINMPPTPKAPNKLPDLSGLFINEIMPDNDSWIADDKGEYEDWLELYNAGEQKLDVGGLFLTDSIENKTKERISSLYPDSTTIPPGGFLLLWADKDKEQGILHLGFKLSKDGEELALFNYDGKLIDQVSYTVPNGLSYGRIENGNSAWTWFNYPTPDASNVFSPLQDYMPDEFSLMVYPNPMTDYIRFEFMLSRPEPVSLRIYHISGSLVYVQQFTPNGNALEVEWNGIFDGGQMLGPGLYVYQAAIGGKIVTGRFVKE